MNVAFSERRARRSVRVECPGMRSRPVRIGLFGRFGSGNLGNDGSLEAVWDHLRRLVPDAEFVCICTDEDELKRRLAIETRPINWSSSSSGTFGVLNRLCRKIPGKLIDIAHTLSCVRSFDMIVVPGTGILDDFGERPRGMPYDLFRWCLAARLNRVQFALVDIGAGPIRNPLSRWLMRAAAGMASYRSYRDSISKEFALEIGIDAKDDQVYPDVAFGLPTPPVRARLPAGSSLAVGLGVMSYRGWYGFALGADAVHARYIETIKEFAVWLLDQGHDVRFVMGEDSDREPCELVLTEALRVRPGLDDGRIAFDRAESLHDVMRQLARTDVVVATRYHSVVCALKLCRPTVALGYARKHDVLLESMGLKGYGLSVEETDLDALKLQFIRLLKDRESLERILRRRNARAIELLAMQFEKLAAKLS
jgi:polysaccharide pyruvyl transferase WcaK-like protein